MAKSKSSGKSGSKQESGAKRRGGRTKGSRAAEVAPAFDMVSLNPGDDAPLAIGADGARTVIFVHGIGNKPIEKTLKCQWDTALFGHPMGDRTRLAYWVNREYYPTPEDATCASPDHIRVDDDEVTTRAIMALSRGESGDEREAIAREIEALSETPEQRRALEAIAAHLTKERPPPAGGVSIKIIPIDWIRRFITPKLTRAFLRDVHDFLYVKRRRELMEQSLADRLAAGGGPFVVIGHSLGSAIAYDVLRQLDRDRFAVRLFLTIGSPLGIEEVQDRLKDFAGGKLQFPRCVERWVNVVDPGDIVAIDRTLAGEFTGGKIIDISHRNPDSPEHPHSGSGYLQMAPVQREVRDAVGVAFGQAVAPFVLAGDLVDRIESGSRDDRHPVLVQLSADKPDAGLRGQNLDDTAAAVEGAIRDMLQRQPHVDGGAAEIDRLRRYLSAKLTRLELETLRSRFKELKIEGIWRNAEKRAFISQSTHTVQARPANLGYGAAGAQIGWAVMDTGIRADHPHFEAHANVVAQWDCTQHGVPPMLERGDPGFDDLDRQGHGTHVAGIIAGRYKIKEPPNQTAADEEAADEEGTMFAGMAPRCQLFGFKVLDDDGNGQDGWIIKALDQVVELNERAGQLVVHGVNLSLGGNFDPSVFGCGHTPLCQELRRLWGQGVLVCLAAGNEGFTRLRAESGLIQANMDISIGDPANLEEAIAIGSVHKTNPHTYGISFFSSRGPTADGRRKPDVVAPGERIVSARHAFKKRNGGQYQLEDLYVEMSGTSMATPHVSGVLAAFLSLRREFIGYPDRVKRILLDGCVDLGRDPYMQGAGLPNLIKMLALN